MAFYLHTFTSDRAYLITDSNKFYYTTDTGRTWHPREAKSPPNSFGVPVLRFHPQVSDNLIWSGDEGCSAVGENCHVEAYYSRDNGNRWNLIETYVRNCAWARDSGLLVDPTQIICESYRDKSGSQRFFQENNPLQLIGGTSYYSTKTKLFEYVVGFTKFSEYLIVAEVCRIDIVVWDFIHQ